jgi:putative flippase GtrA
MPKWWSLLVVAAGTLMLMAVVLINGHPAVFTDTDDYFIEGRTFVVGVAEFLHVKAPDPPPTDPDEIADAKQAAADLHMSHTEIGARSPYYGALLYVSQRIANIWLTTAIQAAIGAWLAFLLWRTALPSAAPWTALAAEASVAFGSTLPFFAGFTMPDVFSGYAAAATTLLLVFWDRLAAWERWALGLLLGAAMTFHTSHLLTAIAVLTLGAMLFRLMKAPRLPAMASGLAVAAAIVGALLANAIYREAVLLKTGDEMRRPPFLAMRVIADGPGRNYLRYACDHGETYVLCQFRKLDLTNSQDMLWSDDRKKGIFNVTGYDNRLQMEKEENSFVLHAFLYDPVGQIIASTSNWLNTLVLVSLDDPLKNPHYYLTNDYWSTTNLPWLINRAADCGRDHWECAPRLSINGSMWLHGGLTVLGLALIAWRLSRADMRRMLIDRSFDWDDDRTRLVAMLALLLGAVVINAFVCGALSGPFARYQARITWLITAGAALSVLSVVPADVAQRIADRLQPLRALPLVQAFERRFDPSFLRFGLVGATGFTIDAGVLHMLTGLARFDYFTGRLCSFSVALGATWLLNRSFTFREPTAHGPARQALIYAAVQGGGAALNIGVYTLAINLAPSLKHMLLIPLAFGSAAGLCLTFLGSKHLAFRPARMIEPGPAMTAEAAEASG